MGLSRLQNFIKNVDGNIIYIDRTNLDATDSIENLGNSPTRPFKTIQRALIEAVRFSYIQGKNNDRFEHTKIHISPGTYYVDNRPGIIPQWNIGDSPSYLYRDLSSNSNFGPLDNNSNFDINDVNNILYKFNSVHGGIIIPRGISIVGEDLKKVKIRPLYVPYPYDVLGQEPIESSAIFRMTGGTVYKLFTVLDADSKQFCYYNYQNNTALPLFSHHKLTAFEYVDGINPIKIKYGNSEYETDRTDLDIYYEKISIAFGNETGRPISPDYPNDIDIEARVDEYRMVASRGVEVGISSIRAGNGVTPSSTITVTIDEPSSEIGIDTPIQIQGITGLDSQSKYNGQYLVSSILSETQIQYKTNSPPTIPLLNSSQLASATLNVISDSVSASSPYICEITLKSVYGMSGLHVDGSKTEGFKSVVVKEFTGISLQKDDRAFLVYNPETGTFNDSSTVENLYSNSRAVFKPDYRNYHIKVSNDGYAQVVSIFAIGYAQHFVTESGGDISVENSSSNFGAKSLIATGFKSSSYEKDDVGYITHIISPKEIDDYTINLEFSALDINKTKQIGNSSRLYLLGESNSGLFPDSVIEGYRIGAKVNDLLNVYIENQKYSAKIVMEGSAQATSSKKYKVKKKTNGISNEISSNIIELIDNHDLANGETVRVFSNTGELPDGIDPHQIYYVITAASGDPLLNSKKIKLTKSLNDANSSYSSSPEIDIYSNESSDLYIVSFVSDKKSGDIGHPIQYDNLAKNWYINVESGNPIYTILASSTNSSTSRTFIERCPDERNIFDTIYRVRYVIPKDSTKNVRPPSDGFVLQDSGSVLGTNSEIGKYYTINSSTLSNSNDLRNPKFIANATWSSGIARFRSEIPHRLTVGTLIEVKNIISTLNISGNDNEGYNGKFKIINILDNLNFEVELNDDPGTFSLEQVINRGQNLPIFRKVELSSTYVVYRSQEVKPYIKNQQDGVYHLILTNSSYSPKDPYFENEKYQQPIQYLYPQINRDNPNSDVDSSKCYAQPFPIGSVLINDPEKSLTKETLYKQLKDFGIGIGITNIVSTDSNNHTIFTDLDHGLNRITNIQISTSGSGYGTGTPGLIYNAILEGSNTGKGATAVISVNSLGNVNDIKIMNGGSAYSIGDTLSIVGVATTSGYTVATATVTNVYNDINTAINITNIDTPHETYNSYYRVVGISTGKAKEIIVSSASSISNYTPSGIGITACQNANLNIVDRTLSATIQYNSATGIGTVTIISSNHGLLLNKKVIIGGANNIFYNGEHIIKNVVDNNKFEIDFGKKTPSPSTAGSIYVYPSLFSSNGGNITKTTETSSARLIPFYDNVISSLSDSVIDTINNTVSINNATTLGLKIGDYLQIDEEIVRIRSTVTSNNVQVFRGVLGSIKKEHSSGSIIRRILPIPTEFRRNSIVKAATHKFEHVGYGPGNYSTALPDKQNRELSEVEKILATKTSINGGLIVFAGMSDSGDFFIGNKKVNSATGEERDFDSPIPSVTGEELDIGGLDVGFDVLTPLEVSISRSIVVEGGNDRNIISKFNGPVIFNNKITANSAKGFETRSLYLQGDVDISRKYTVGISTPSIPGTYGDIVYNANPLSGGTIGWVYTQGDNWEKFGVISNNEVIIGNAVGVSVNGSPLGLSDNINFVGSGSAQVTGSYSSGSSTITLNVVTNSGVLNNLVVVGPSTFNSISNHNNGIRVTGISSFIGPINVTSNANISGILSATSLNSNAINVTSLNVQNLNNTGIVTFSGDISIGSPNRNLDSYIRVQSSDSYLPGFQAHGNSSGAGYLYVGRNNQTGGGIAFNGNSGNPFSIGETVNTVQFYRSDSGTRSSVFSYPSNSNTVTFTGEVVSALSGVFSTPNSGTTGGLVVRANSITNKNYLQFTNSNRTAQWGFVEVNSLGDFTWSGKLKSTSIETVAASTTNSVVSGILTASQVNATTFYGGGIIPIGGIIMWSGSILTLSENWKLCNGENGTPDLRDRFIVGAGSTYSIGDTGGQNTVTLTSNQLPTHNHNYSFNTTSGSVTGISALPGLFNVVTSISNNTTTTTTGNTGSGLAHENRPPYYALAFIMRVS